MKTIVAPTDFSENSLNAVEFAASLAELNGSRLHVHLPVLSIHK